MEGTHGQAAGLSAVLRKQFPKLAVCPGSYIYNNYYDNCKTKVNLVVYQIYTFISTFFLNFFLLSGTYLRGLTTTAEPAGE